MCSHKYALTYLTYLINIKYEYIICMKNMMLTSCLLDIYYFNIFYTYYLNHHILNKFPNHVLNKHNF